MKGRCGEEIDSNDYVIRANFAGLDGYEADVGNKTSIMMLNDATLTRIYNTLIAKRAGTEGVTKMLHYIKRNLNDSVIWFAKSTQSHNSASRLQKIAKFFVDSHLRPKLAYSMMQVSQTVYK